MTVSPKTFLTFAVLIALGISSPIACYASAQPSFMFVVESQHAILDHVKDQQFTLTIPLKDIKSILMFSDRPNRIAMRITPSKFAKSIHKGADSFDAINPNAVLAWGCQDIPASVYTITSYQKNKTNITYKLNLVGEHVGIQHRAISGKATLFIDSFTICDNPTSKTCFDAISDL